MTEFEKAMSNDLSAKAERSVAFPAILIALGKSVSIEARFKRVISTSSAFKPAFSQNAGVPPMSRIFTGLGKLATKPLKRFSRLDLNEEARELGFLLSAMEEKIIRSNSLLQFRSKISVKTT